jgi:hypothetical protein
MKSGDFAIGSSGHLSPDATTDAATELINLGLWVFKSPDHPITKSPDRL